MSCVDIEFTLSARASRAIEPDSRRIYDAEARVWDAGQELGAFPGHVELDATQLRVLLHDSTGYGTYLATQFFEANPSFQQALTVGLSRGSQTERAVRVRLRLDREDPWIHSVSWEHLRDPRSGRGTLATSEQILLSRYFPTQYQPRQRQRLNALRALAVVADPCDSHMFGLKLIDRTAVVKAMTESLAVAAHTTVLGGESGRPRATRGALANALSARPDILCLICHGRRVDDQYAVLLEQDDGTHDWVQVEALAEQLTAQPPALVVLAACKSAGEHDDEQSLHALGMCLAKAGIGAVVAMQDNVSMATIACFLPCFFRQLWVDGCIDRAVAAARREVYAQPDACSPVLYMHLLDGQLFEPVILAQHHHGAYASIATPVQGAHLAQASAPDPRRRRAGCPLPPHRDFVDRHELLASMEQHLLPTGGTWITGPLGVGATALLCQAMNMPQILSRFTSADGAGVVVPSSSTPIKSHDDLIQSLYTKCYQSTVGQPFRPDPASALDDLSRLNGLFILDRAPISKQELRELAQRLRETGAVAIVSAAEAPDDLVGLRLGGLPLEYSLAVLGSRGGVDLSRPEAHMEAEQLCAVLEGLPLALKLAGRLASQRSLPLAQIAEAVAALGHEPEPLSRIVRYIVRQLAPDTRTVLAGLTGFATHARLPRLAKISRLAQGQTEVELSRLKALWLVEEDDQGNYCIAATSLRRTLERVLDREPARRAAALFASLAPLHRGDLPWLEREAANLLNAARVALEANDGAQAGAILQALQPYAVRSGLWGLWSEVADGAARAAALSGSESLRAWALHEQGTRAGMQGDLATAADLLDQARRLRQELGDQAGAATTTNNMVYFGLLPPPPGGGQAEHATRRSRPPHWLAAGTAVMAILLGALALFLSNFPPPRAALAAISETSGSYPLEVAFDASGSSDPNFGDQLTYIWDFGDGTPRIETAEALLRHTYPSPGVFQTQLWVRDSRGSTSASPVSLQIDVVNAPPTVSLLAPLSSSPVHVGQALTLRGQATDPEEGRLPERALRWTVIMREGEQTHIVLPPTAGNELSVMVPQPSRLAAMASAYLEVQLTAMDSLGATSSVLSQTVRPTLADMILATQPPGLQLMVNDKPVVAPYPLTAWSSAVLTVTAPMQEDASGQMLVFGSWTDNVLSATRSITVPRAGATYTATFLLPTARIELAQPEVSEASGLLLLPVILDRASDAPVTIAYRTKGGSAGADEDYKSIEGVLMFPPGNLRQEIALPLIDDQHDEADENIVVQLHGARNAALSANSVTVTVIDDDPEPSLVLAQPSISVRESAGHALVAVRLSAPSGRPVQLTYATANGSASAGADYELRRGTLEITPGVTSATFQVPIRDDNLYEVTETVLFTLVSASNAVLATPARGTLSIEDDEPPPAIAFAGASYRVSEGDRQAVIRVTLGAAAGRDIRVRYTTADESAVAGGDYAPLDELLTIRAGATSAEFTIQINDDQLNESEDSLAVMLRDPDGARLTGPARAQLVIVDNDPLPTLTLETAALSAQEDAGEAGFTVRLALSGQTVSVEYVITGRSATGGDDYEEVGGGTLTFAPGETTKRIPLRLLDDRLDELDETVQVQLQNVFNASAGAVMSSTLTIIDNDIPLVQFNSPTSSVDESKQALQVGVRLDIAPMEAVTIAIRRAGGTASEQSDYRLAQDEIVFPAGATSASFEIALVSDSIDEENETLVLELVSPEGGAALGETRNFTLVISDDDPAPRIGFIGQQSLSIIEHNGNQTFTVGLFDQQGRSIFSGRVVEVTLVLGGTATQGEDGDYRLEQTRLVFQPGEQNKLFTIAFQDDDRYEEDETITIQLVPINAAPISTAANLTITLTGGQELY